MEEDAGDTLGLYEKNMNKIRNKMKAILKEKRCCEIN